MITGLIKILNSFDVIKFAISPKMNINALPLTSIVIFLNKLFVGMYGQIHQYQEVAPVYHFIKKNLRGES